MNILDELKKKDEEKRQSQILEVMQEFDFKACSQCPTNPKLSVEELKEQALTIMTETVASFERANTWKEMEFMDGVFGRFLVHVKPGGIELFFMFKRASSKHYMY